MRQIRIRKAKDPHPQSDGSASARLRIRIRKATDPHPQGYPGTDPHPQGYGSASARRRIRIRKATDPHLQGQGHCIRILIEACGFKSASNLWIRI
jgi:hypothetical protein